MTPTARTLALYRKLQLIAGVTERWQASFAQREGQKRSGVRVDLFGFIDLIRLGHKRCAAVQVTSFQCMAERRRKIEGRLIAKGEREEKHLKEVAKNALAWAKTGNDIEVVGWRKKLLPTKAGGKKARWFPTIQRAEVIADENGQSVWTWHDVTEEFTGGDE